MTASFFPKRYAFFVAGSQVGVVCLSNPLTGRFKFQSVEYLHSEDEGLEGAILKAVERFSISRMDTVHLYLPSDVFSYASFSLPKLAAKKLDTAVRLNIPKHLPIKNLNYKCGYSTSTGATTIDVSACILFDEDYRFYSDMFANCGLQLTSVAPDLMFVAMCKGWQGVFVEQVGETLLVVIKENGKLVYHGAMAATAETMQQVVTSELSFAVANTVKKPVEHAYIVSPGISPAIEGISTGLSSFIDKVKQVEPDHLEYSYLEKDPYSIRAMSASSVRGKSIFTYLTLAFSILCLLSVFGIPLSLIQAEKERVNTLQTMVSSARSNLKKAEKAKTSIKKQFSMLEDLVAVKTKNMSVVDLEKELSEIIPKNTWLQSFVYKRDEVIVSGRSPNSSDILELIENSPLFEKARFSAQIVKKGEIEIFTITAKVTEVQ